MRVCAQRQWKKSASAKNRRESFLFFFSTGADKDRTRVNSSVLVIVDDNALQLVRALRTAPSFSRWPRREHITLLWFPSGKLRTGSLSCARTRARKREGCDLQNTRRAILLYTRRNSRSFPRGNERLAPAQSRCRREMYQGYRPIMASRLTH